MKNDGNGNSDVEAPQEAAMSGLLREEEMQSSAGQIEDLASMVMERARMLEMQVNNNALINTTANLKNAIEYLGTVAGAALTRPMPEPVVASPTKPGTKGGCGCSDKEEGCDPSRLPSCCVELYIRQVDIGRSDIGNITDLECIVAVKGERSWGMSDTGVAGFISMHPKSGPVPMNAVIERHCVPCNGTRTVPLWFQCREIDKVGRDEVGSERGFITLRCDCEIADVTQRVTVTGSVLGTFEIFITVGARVIPGGCC